MGVFTYISKYWNERCLAAKCDICEAMLWTDITGKDFAEYSRFAYEHELEHGEFITIARAHGWEHRKSKDGKWIDICDECVRFEREKKRQEYFDALDFKEGGKK